MAIEQKLALTQRLEDAEFDAESLRQSYEEKKSKHKLNKKRSIT